MIISYYYLTKLLPTVPQCNTIGLTKKIQKEMNEMAQKLRFQKTIWYSAQISKYGGSKLDKISPIHTSGILTRQPSHP